MRHRHRSIKTIGSDRRAARGQTGRGLRDIPAPAIVGRDGEREAPVVRGTRLAVRDQVADALELPLAHLREVAPRFEARGVAVAVNAREPDLTWSARHLAEFVTPGGGRRGTHVTDRRPKCQRLTTKGCMVPHRPLC